ncbi:MAG: hypothetical protein K2N70_04565 [Helicobacter sp.]|nr:hypothetical protein [Helicobacter sp.]
MCVALAYVNSPSAASMLCLWLEHRRCALWLERLHNEQWQIEMFRLCLNMTMEVRF